MAATAREQGQQVNANLEIASFSTLRSQLFGASPYDSLTLTVAPAILLVVALLGCLIPLRQVIRLDPAVALRRDRATGLRPVQRPAAALPERCTIVMSRRLRDASSSAAVRIPEHGFIL